jgi:hypothetical protein
MWWQALLVAAGAAGFPTLALLYFIGGPRYRDRPAGTGAGSKAAAAVAAREKQQKEAVKRGGN